MKKLEEFTSIVKPLISKKVSSSNGELISALSDDGEMSTELAIAILLVDIAMIDQEFDSREYSFIVNKFQSIFEISQEDVKKLITQAKNYLGQMRGLSGVTEQLKESLTEEELAKLGQTISGLIKADDNEDGFEIYLKNKLSKTLDIPIE